MHLHPYREASEPTANMYLNRDNRFSDVIRIPAAVGEPAALPSHGFV